jgi:subtilisin family serine protease
MAHYFDAARIAIQLDPSPDDIGVRFGGEGGAQLARRAARSVRLAHRAAAAPARRFGRFMILNDPGAAVSPVGAVARALPRRYATHAARTMPVFIERGSKLKLVATDQILVRFTRRATLKRRRALLSGLGLELIGVSEFDSTRHVVVPTQRDASRTLDLANRLVEADDVIEFAAPNFLSEVRKRSVNDPLFPRQWHLENTGQDGALPGQDVRAVEAWNLVGGGDRSIVIAIIDDGVDLAHPDLRPNLWRNPKRGARDLHGRDFTDTGDAFDPSPKVFNAPFDDTDTNDIHGTPCAGVAVAAGNNKRGVAGVAWNCRLLAVKMVAGSDFAPDDRIADAVRYAAVHADVLSCSWGVAPHPDIQAAFTFAVEKGRRGRGCVVCVATGNENAKSIGFPSNHEAVLAIGACNDRGKRSKYSNFGAGIDLVAPSSDEDRPGIVTTDVRAGKGYSAGAYCDDFGGTSSATPLAAGVAALVLSANKRLTHDRVYDVLTSTADKIDQAKGDYTKGYSLKYGFGRVNAAAAVAKALKSKKKKAKP